MFKSKINFNEFDTHNEKVKDLEQTKVKALSKSSVKKLAGAIEEPAPFHLIVDYFKDDKDKPSGHFLGFGLNKKLDKHFQQVEMKPGKADKRMSASQKEASMGNAYIKEEGGKKLLCFEPNPSSKIPGGKWPKILKALKTYLSGIKAVVILNGQVVGGEDTDSTEEGATDETATDATDAAADATDATDEMPNDDSGSAPSSGGNFGKIEEAFNKIKKALGDFQKESDNKKKAKMIAPLLANVQKVLDATTQFVGAAPEGDEKTAAAGLQTKLEAYKTSLTKMNETVGKKYSEATVKGMSDIFAKIQEEANRLKGEHAEELAGLDADFDSILADLT